MGDANLSQKNKAVLDMMGAMLQSQQKVLPFEFEDIGFLFLSILSDSTAISKSSGTGTGRGLHAARQCLQSLGDLKAFQWFIVDVNAHDEDSNLLSEYDDAVAHLRSLADEDATILCCLRTDLKENDALAMTVICGSDDTCIDIDHANSMMKSLGGKPLQGMPTIHLDFDKPLPPLKGNIWETEAHGAN